MPFSTTPGSTLACTLQLPQPASATVQWVVRDPSGGVVAEGQQPPTGTLVAVAFVMPSTATIPLDGSSYVLTATDGITSVSDSIALIGALDPSYSYDGYVAYRQGKNFTDVLITDREVTQANVTVTLADGSVLKAATVVDLSQYQRMGNGYAYRVDLGVLDTRTMTTYGTGIIEWDFLLDGALENDQVQHAFWTITPYSSTYLASIRKLVDRAMIGDANRYLNITMADLANAMIRGMEVVIASPPTSTPFALDQTPISLRDYVIKAGAVDLLRAQYLAEGMSAFDMQGEGVQLNVDRSQYIDALAQQLQGDLQGLVQAKNAWQQQGMPMGGTLVPGRRPIGILGLTTGLYSNFSVQPMMLGMNGSGYSFLDGQARQQQLMSFQLSGGAPSPGY